MGTDDTSDGMRETMMTALFFALATGFIECCIAAFQILALHRIVGVSPDLFWMAPLANLIFFLPLAVVPAIVARLTKRPVRRATVIALFAFLSAFSLFVPYTTLATWAEAVLSVGLAIQLAQLVTAHPKRWEAALRIGTRLMFAAVIIASVGIRGTRALGERRALAALPEPAAGHPNVLLIIFDTVRRKNLGLYGYDRATTPELARWARDGVVFEQATSTAPWTLPSHASIFTGLQAADVGVGWTTPLPDAARTLAEALGAHGYETGGFVANHLYASYETGLQRGFVHYDDYRVSLRLILAHSAFGRSDFVNSILDERSAESVKNALRHFTVRSSVVPSSVPRTEVGITDAFLAWQGTTGKRPFFAFLNYMTAHAPYRAREPFVSRFAQTPAKPYDRYDAAIAMLDHEVGRMLDSLRRRGALDNTVVVVTSDHGEQFGEHKLKGHANSLYLPLLEVPLIIRYPGSVPAGRRIAPVVSMSDLAPTLLDLSGNQEPFHGSSLTRYWRGAAEVPAVIARSELAKGINVSPAFPNARSDMHSLVDERFHYIVGEAGREELYEYVSDSLEMHNLAGDPAMQHDLERLRRELTSVSPK